MNSFVVFYSVGDSLMHVDVPAATIDEALCAARMQNGGPRFTALAVVPGAAADAVNAAMLQHGQPETNRSCLGRRPGA